MSLRVHKDPAIVRYPCGMFPKTALELATQCTDKEIIFLGLDLCYDDILSHAKPNAFDSLLQSSQSRLEPHHSLSYKRALLYAPAVDSNAARHCRTSLPLDTYAGWFESLSGEVKDRIFRLCPSHRKLSCFHDIEESAFLDLMLKYRPAIQRVDLKKLNYEQFSIRERIAGDILQEWDAQLARISNKIEKTQNLTWLMTDAQLLQLLHFIDPATLADTKRKMRAKGHLESIASARKLLSHSHRFIDTLRRKIDCMKITDYGA